MQDQHLDHHFSDLIARYLSGAASDTEVHELENWVLADPKNKAQFIAAKKAWILGGMAANSQNIDVNKNWESVSKQIFEPKVSVLKPRINRRSWLAIAASLAILVIAAWWVIQKNSQPSEFYAATTNESQTIELPDGSEVILNPQSSVKFESDKKRKVQLTGNAFFDVKRDKAHPFVIQTDPLEIEVLGTSFYVDARDEVAEIQVIVKSGSVAVRTDKTEEVLKPDEKAVYRKDNQQLNKTVNDDQHYLSIKSKNLVFENTTLEEIVFSLNRQYGANIEFKNQEIKNCKLTVTLNNKSLDAVFKIIENTLKGIQFQRNNGKMLLTGTNCE